MNPLRICMVTTFYPPYGFGGDAIAVQRLARALARREHQVTVIHDEDAFRALHQGDLPDRPAETVDQGVRIIRLRSHLGRLSPLLVQQFGRPVLHARRLRALLAPGAWDVVNFHNVSLIGGPGILAYPSGAVTLYTAHEHWLVCPTHVLWRHRREPCDRRECLRCVLAHRRPPQLWRYTGAVRRGLEHVDAVLALSAFSRDKHLAFGLGREMEILPPFLPDDDEEPPEGPPPGPRPYFLYSGRLEPFKGLDDLLESFQGVTTADLVIAGEGSAAETWRRRTAGQPHIRWLGPLSAESLRAWRRGAVAAIVPSLVYETFGLVIIEALRDGIPVIARRRGPFPEILADTEGGILFSTPQELRQAVEELLHNPSRRERLAAGARATYERRYTDHHVVPAYLELIARVAHRKGVSGPGVRPSSASAGTH